MAAVNEPPLDCDCMDGHYNVNYTLVEVAADSDDVVMMEWRKLVAKAVQE